MKKMHILFLVLVFALFCLGLFPSQQNPEGAKFQKTMDTYFDEYWKFYPTAATLAGFYKYNDKLEDLSEKNIEKRQDALDTFNQEFVTKIDKTKLEAETMIDYGILINALDLEMMRFENLIPWEYNPLFYNEIILQNIRSLLVKEFAPLDARLKSATERAKQLPGLIRQAKENLKTPPQIHTETAIKQFPGIIGFYRTELPKLIESASSDIKAKFQAEIVKVIPALEDYQSFLTNQLLPRSTGNFRLGDQAHSRLLILGSEFTIPAAELAARANADYKNLRREMFFVCIPFFKIMYPNIDLEQLGRQKSQDEVFEIGIQGVLDKFKVEHPAREDFLARTKADFETIKKFITEKQLIDVPGIDLAIEPMPAAESGISWNRLLSPGPYETGGNYVAQVSSLPDEWSAEEANSFLEGYNNFYFYFWIIRQIYPGWFVPTFFTQKHPSLVRKLYPNMSLIKGWPVYVEEMMIYKGFGNYDLRLRLNQLKSQLKIVMDFLLDINIHQGGMTKEQAISYMTQRGFQTSLEAERRWTHILLMPGDASYPYIGIQEIWDMEKDYKKMKGDAFSQKEFLQKLLSFGALPVRHLKAKMAQ